MFRKILVPLDGSSTSETILPWVRWMLRHEQAQVVLLRVVSPLPGGIEDPARANVRDEKSMSYLEKVARGLEIDASRLRTLSRLGFPAEVILDVAASEEVSMITMATHGETGLSRWAFGSVTDKVIRASHFPVFVIRSFPAPLPPTTEPIRNILVPCDGSELSREILPCATEFARHFDARIKLVYVAPAAGDEGDSSHALILQKAQEVLEGSGVPYSSLILGGDPASQILDACEPNFIGMIAMSTHGYAGDRRWVFGSVAEKVITSGTVPALIMRGWSQDESAA